MTHERTIMRAIVAGSAIATVLATGPAASAKGGELLRIEIVGPGLVRPIELSREEVAAWPQSSGMWEEKWSEPYVGGASGSAVELGFSYRVSLFLDCEGTRSTVLQTLYPFAVGGPQVLTPPDAEACGGPLPAGYFPAPESLLEHFRERGLASHIPGTADLPGSPAEAGDGTVAVPAEDPGGSSTPALLVGLAALALALSGLGGWAWLRRASRSPRDVARDPAA